MNLKPTFLAAALVAFGPLAAHAQLSLTVDNLVSTVPAGSTTNITGYITNTDTVSHQITSDSFSGPYDSNTGNLSVTWNWNDDFSGSLLNQLETTGPITLAPGASSADVPLLQVIAPNIQGVQSYGLYTVNDDVAGVSSNTATVVVGTATPEFSTVAMMAAGSGGMLLQLARRRMRK